MAEALRITRAPGVDVSSGVERAPGEKDHEKIEAFIGDAGWAQGGGGCLRLRGPGAESGEWRMTVQQPNSFRTGPDERGHFGIYGGRFVAETLMPLILELEQRLRGRQGRSWFFKSVRWTATSRIISAGPVPALFRRAHDRPLGGGAKIYFKRDELNHTGAHKVNNVLGQIMLARRMGKPRVIAETGAGQHGVATATLCARFGLKCAGTRYGLGRRRAAEAERVPHENARRGSPARRVRLEDAERCDERSVA